MNCSCSKLSYSSPCSQSFGVRNTDFERAASQEEALSEQPSTSGAPQPTIYELIWHASDSSVKPIVANRRIERLPEPKWDAEVLPFSPLVSIHSLLTHLEFCLSTAGDCSLHSWTSGLLSFLPLVVVQPFLNTRISVFLAPGSCGGASLALCAHADATRHAVGITAGSGSLSDTRVQGHCWCCPSQGQGEPAARLTDALL